MDQQIVALAQLIVMTVIHQLVNASNALQDITSMVQLAPNALTRPSAPLVVHHAFHVKQTLRHVIQPLVMPHNVFLGMHSTQQQAHALHAQETHGTLGQQRHAHHAQKELAMPIVFIATLETDIAQNAKKTLVFPRLLVLVKLVPMASPVQGQDHAPIVDKESVVLIA